MLGSMSDAEEETTTSKTERSLERREEAQKRAFRRNMSEFDFDILNMHKLHATAAKQVRSGKMSLREALNVKSQALELPEVSVC